MADLDFSAHNTLYATHGLHAYAAKCPPQLAAFAICSYSRTGELVLDPMVGSGTTLVEARLNGRRATGFDIDPLACLIAQVKCSVVDDDEIVCAYDSLLQQTLTSLGSIQRGCAPSSVINASLPPDFPNMAYWFEPEVALSLSLLSHHIETAQCTDPVKRFLWVGFSSLILSKTSVANARDIIHSRHHHYVHARPPDVLSRFGQVVARMRRQMSEYSKSCDPAVPVPEVHRGDARDLPLQSGAVDLAFTSPPYATALDYYRAHFLAVPWMRPILRVGYEEYRAKAPEYIGSERGHLPTQNEVSKDVAAFPSARSALANLKDRSERQTKLIHRYFVDMLSALSEIARVVRPGGHAVIVVCPSHIRKVRINTHDVLTEMADCLGMAPLRRYTRSISERRRLLPYVRHAFGDRMDTEYVLVFRKRGRP